MSADAQVHLSDAGTVSEGIQILISYALWNQWAEIAIERESAAREARGLLVAQHRHERQFAESLSAELLAAMVSISAAAHALDALYGQLITPQIRAVGPKDDVRREAHIRECLKRRFVTGRKDKGWVSAFGRLFNLRDAAVHAEQLHLPAVTHPSGVTQAGQVNADYCVEAAADSVELLLDVLQTCGENPKPGDAVAVNWSKDYEPCVRKLLGDRAVISAARPIAVYNA